MIKVYVASAYTVGDIAVNVRKSIDVGNELINEGFAPYLPLLSHFQHMVHPQPYETWLGMDLEWVLACDVLLRVPGESKGADKEVEWALTHHIPVFYTIAELKLWRTIQEKEGWG